MKKKPNVKKPNVKKHQDKKEYHITEVVYVDTAEGGFQMYRCVNDTTETPGPNSKDWKKHSDKLEPTLKNIQELYWCCSECATKAGGVYPEGHVCTMTSGPCGLCNTDTTLIPWVDFNWPKSRDDDFAARIRRDFLYVMSNVENNVI